MVRALRAPSWRLRADWIPAYAGMTVNVGAAALGATLTLALSRREREFGIVVPRGAGREGDAGGVARA